MPTTPDDATPDDTGPVEPTTDTSFESTDDKPSKANSEAAKYRTRLREVEAERDTLLTRVTAQNRALVERLAAERMAVPGDVWLTGLDLADLLDTDGEPDPKRVAEALDAVLADRPTWVKRSPTFDGGVRPVIPSDGSWSDVLRGNRTRRT